MTAPSGGENADTIRLSPLCPPQIARQAKRTKRARRRAGRRHSHGAPSDALPFPFKAFKIGGAIRRFFKRLRLSRIRLPNLTDENARNAVRQIDRAIFFGNRAFSQKSKIAHSPIARKIRTPTAAEVRRARIAQGAKSDFENLKPLTTNREAQTAFRFKLKRKKSDVLIASGNSTFAKIE
ncbi:MAG: hypothetical protein DBX55_01940 [Verrucomicrobia bacterium]|nr:MAG: hypothetical protein DBX55_01940 [Verrucomicrobiota bacterium]